MEEAENPRDSSGSFERFFNEVGSEAGPLPLTGPPFKLDDDSSSSDRRDALVAALRELSRLEGEASLNEEGVDEFISFFVTLYGKGGGYRHSCSDVFSVLYDYLKTDGELDQSTVSTEAMTLACNVNLIITAMEDKKRERVQHESQCRGYDEAVQSLRKLGDHIEFERVCLECIVVQKHLIETVHEARDASKKALVASKEIRNVDKNMRIVTGEIRHSLDEAKQEYWHSLDEAKREYREMADRSKREYVTILGVFAAVVVTFTSGFAFSASVLQDIGAADIYRLLFVALMLGWFLFDLLAMLLAFIGRVSGLFVTEPGYKRLKHNICMVNGIFLFLFVVFVILRLTGVSFLFLSR